ncbi:MAG: hypothetical protein AAFR16_05070, partial [Pseudomonadota bacterium]
QPRRASAACCAAVSTPFAATSAPSAFATAMTDAIWRVSAAPPGSACVSALGSFSRRGAAASIAESEAPPAQQAALARLGCDALQGALISPPLSAEAFAARAAAAPAAAAAG